MIRLLQPIACDKNALAYWAQNGEPYSVMEIAWATQARPHTTGTALVNGARIHVMFDTGSAFSLLTLHAAERAGVTPDSAGVVKAGLIGGLGTRTEQTWIAPVQSFKIGDEEIKQTKLRFGDISLPEADMLIGTDFFLSHRIYVASLAQAGRLDEARAALARLQELHPENSIAWIERNVPYTPGPMAKFLEGFRKAGLQ